MGNPTFSSLVHRRRRSIRVGRHIMNHDGMAPSGSGTEALLVVPKIPPVPVSKWRPRTDENGSWILASVQHFYADTKTYYVQDEDRRYHQTHSIAMESRRATQHGYRRMLQKRNRMHGHSPQNHKFLRAIRCLEAADMEVDARKYLTYCEGVVSQI
mmetsp:Transcript_10166/g.18509  ORF Transcript_10166/g.18509 Transcript_10166/m.18509 type:complete len:156 (-) Transcript_10166:326-793(-)